MISITPPAGVSSEKLRAQLLRDGFHAVEIQENGDTWEIQGVSPTYQDEFGGAAMIDEADRDAVESSVQSLSSKLTLKSRAKELRDKPVMTQTELTEAVKILLSLIED